MSDEQTIYIDPDDDLTTVRERLEQIPSRKITLVIPSQTQLRSHVAWKLLYARARELGKEVLIVSSDPQVRSVAHGVKFKVVHSLESTSSPGRTRSGSREGSGRSGSSTTRSRPTGSSTTTTRRVTTAKEPAAGRGATQSSRNTRSSFSRDDPTIYDFRAEDMPAIHPLPITQIEEPDLLFEDYAQAQDIREAASGHMPAIKMPKDAAPEITISTDINKGIPGAEASPTPTDRSPQPISPIYGDDDPFIYMQDDSQPPSQSEQKGEAILEDDEVVQEFPLLQKSAISNLPTNVTEKRSEYRSDEDEDDSIPPISPPTSITQARSRNTRSVTEEEKTEGRGPQMPSPPYGIRPKGSRSGTLPPSRQTHREEEDQLPAIPERSMPMQVPQPISLPMGRGPSTPSARPPSKELVSRKSGNIAPKATTQRPSTELTRSAGSRAPSKSLASRPTPQPSQQRTSSAGPKIPREAALRRPVTTSTNRARRPRRLFFIVASMVVILVVLFAVLYFNTTSTVALTVKSQDYAHTVTLALSANQNQSGTVFATSITQPFTETKSEPATGNVMQQSNYATGNVIFTNTGTTNIVIPSQTLIETSTKITFETTVNVSIAPQSAGLAPLAVSIQAVNMGASGDVRTGTIVIIPQDSLTSIAQAQTPAVTADSLAKILSVSNPDPTTGGGPHQVSAVTQQDLTNATNDLRNLALPDIANWMQDKAKHGIVADLTTTDTLINPPSVDTPEPDGTFSASIKVTATILVAQLADAQKAAASQLNSIVQADKQFGANFAIIGDPQKTIKIPQTITLDQVQQGVFNKTSIVTLTASGKVGPNLNIANLQNSIKGKSISEAKAILQQKSQSITAIDIQTQPAIFNWVSPWIDHIAITVSP